MKNECHSIGLSIDAPRPGGVCVSIRAAVSRAFSGMVAAAVGLAAAAAFAAELPLSVGVIGLDAHAVAWAKILAAATPVGPHPELTDLKIVAAVPAGSPDIPEKQQPLADGIACYREAGIELVDSIAALLPKVDAVMILGVDGRPHLAQAREVIAAGKPLFIDKPVAASLADARQIYALAEARGVPVFSSSALRFAPGTRGVKSDLAVGAVIGCDAHSPCRLEPHHPDLFWYGIHGVETLFTIMGPGCRQVTRTKTADTDVVVGLWQDGRIGTFRGHRTGPHDYGATVFGTQGIAAAGRFEGYEPLLVEIARFFRTGKPPVSPAETLEIIAFMEAADASAARGGAAVPLEPAAAPPPQVPYDCRFTEQKIVIDGRIDEPAWREAALIDRFSLPWLAPHDPPAAKATRARLLWDREHLYVAADMDDGDLFADVKEHDGKTCGNDVFEIFLKPSVEKPGYYEFHVTPNNTRFDLFLPRRGHIGRFRRECEFHVTSAVTVRGTLDRWDDRDEGWTAEMRIPWADLMSTGGGPEPGDEWRFALCRSDFDVAREQPELSTAAPLNSLPHPNFHHFEDYAPIRFSGPSGGPVRAGEARDQ